MAELLFEELDVYKTANEIGKQVWNLVSRWNYFARDTLGKQVVRSADSIALNICEGYGRFYYKEKKLFYYYSRGSLYETHEALKKAMERQLISESEFRSLSDTIVNFSISLNAFINSVGTKKNTEVIGQKTEVIGAALSEVEGSEVIGSY